jgi:hypothetical protein
MTSDLKNALTWSSPFASKSQATNNTAGTVVDTQQYIGTMAFRVNIGIKTAGDNDGAITVLLQDSATNNASNAANISGATVSTTNNTAAVGTLQLDPRAQNRYIFPRIILSGTNSPAYPVSVEVAGTKKVQ